MKIAFLGDSITYGVPGVSYFDMLESQYDGHEFVNMGKGGDTVNSLYKRIKKEDLSAFDQVVLFVGVNDLFLQTSLSLKVIKTLKHVKFSRSVEEFKDVYTRLLNHVLSQVESVYLIPPLLIGENLSSEWNKRLSQLADVVKDMAQSLDKVTLIPARERFLATLKDKPISDYISSKSMQIMKDVRDMHSAYLVDQKSSERGLHLTLDGVHINTLGAKLIKEAIEETLNLRS